ncbi:MAG: OsmC family protein [Acidimicrobiia bacterium]
MTITYTLNGVDAGAVAALTDTIAGDPEQGRTVWKTEVAWNGAFRSEARVRDFAPVPSDEPILLGGSDTASNPVEQLLGALGNCLAVGVAANATARNVRIDRLRICLEGDLDLRVFLGLAGGHAGFDAIRARVDIETDADPAVVEELLERVAATSPVGHTLSNQVPVTVTRA